MEEKRLEKWSKPYIVQPKLDGDRCRAIIGEYGDVTLLSSEENNITSVPHIVHELHELGLKSVELDGELYHHGTSHQTIHGTVARTVNLHPEHEQVEYHVFDYVSAVTQIARTLNLWQMFEETEHIKKVQSQPAESIEHIMNLMKLYQEQGYEGIVVRNINYPYLRKRSTGMMKWKPRRDDYYVVVGVEEEISIEGEPKNSLGALWLEAEGGERFKVGSGSFLTRENRHELWQIKESLINRIAHIKYQHLTDRRVPRFPVLVELVSNPSFKI
jgi:ATP-dependent DNA ligase